MKFLVVTHNLLPQPTGFGSAIHVWSIIHTMVQRGNEVHLVIYDVGQYSVNTGWKTEANQRSADQLVQLGVTVHVLPTKETTVTAKNTMVQSGVNVLRRILQPSPVDYYAGPIYRKELDALIRDLNPDVLFAYTFDATSLIAEVKDRLKVSSVVDLDHLARSERLLKVQPKSLRDWAINIIDRILMAQLPKVMVEIVKKCDLVIEHAHHHKEWLVSKGVQNVIYMPVMVLDYARELLAADREPAAKPGKIKIAMVGKLNGIATLTGLQLFVDEIIPRIDQSPILDEIEIHIIGGGQVPHNLKTSLSRPYILHRGYVEDIHAEFLSCDLVLVPTPIDLGFRTRIAEAFSFGCCVIAHTANAAGMPELIHDSNVLLGDNGAVLFEQLTRCVNSAELRHRLGAAARTTFETEMTGTLVSERLVGKIETMLTGR